jgi:hypothetical protein
MPLVRVARWLAGIALLAPVVPAFAADAWAFRFNVRTFNTSWHDDLSFHNTTDSEAVIHLVGVSNGGINEGDLLDVAVPVGRTVSLTDLFGVWGTDAFPELWVVHFDAPDGVLVSSRGGLDSECPSPCGQPPNPFPNLGAFTMPVFRSLAPANTRQFHFGADLGAVWASPVVARPGRSNVGIYNAGNAEAAAVVSLHRACDDALIATRTVRVPTNSAVQVGIQQSSEPVACAETQKLNQWLRYVTVVVDQPSLSYVFNLAEDAPNFTPLPFGVAGN